MSILFRYKYVWLALVSIFLVGYLFFSPSRLDQMREKRAMKKNKSLVQKVMENAKMKQTGGVVTSKRDKTPSGLRYGLDRSSDIETTDENENADGRSRRSRANRYIPGMQDNSGAIQNPGFSNPYLNGQVRSNTPSYDTVPTPAPAPADMYYPPSASKGGKPESSLKNKELFDPGFGVLMKGYVKTAKYDSKNPKNPKNYELKEMRVAFEGIRAYSLDSDGKPQPLADGFYQMPNTTRKVLILNGKKVISN